MKTFGFNVISRIIQKIKTAFSKPNKATSYATGYSNLIKIGGLFCLNIVSDKPILLFKDGESFDTSSVPRDYPVMSYSIKEHYPLDEVFALFCKDNKYSEKYHIECDSCKLRYLCLSSLDLATYYDGAPTTVKEYSAPIFMMQYDDIIFNNNFVDGGKLYSATCRLVWGSVAIYGHKCTIVMGDEKMLKEFINSLVEKI